MVRAGSTIYAFTQICTKLCQSGRLWIGIHNTQRHRITWAPSRDGGSSVHRSPLRESTYHYSYRHKPNRVAALTQRPNVLETLG